MVNYLVRIVVDAGDTMFIRGDYIGIVVESQTNDYCATTTAVEGNSDCYQRHMVHQHAHNNAQIAEEMWVLRCKGCCRILSVSTCFLFIWKGIVFLGF